MRIKILIAFLAVAVLSGCGESPEEIPVSSEYKDKGRFEIVDKFKSLDDKSGSGFLLKDRKTGVCYLYVAVGVKKAGMVEAPCDNNG